MDLISDPNALSNVLNLLSANDTNSVKQGEKLLKTASKKPQFLLSLLNQVSGSPVVEIRHHAALLLKKKMEGLFKKLMSSHQAAIKTQLLSILGSEPAKSVAVSIAGCVASAAKASFSVGIDWPELFQAIMVMAQSPNETQRVLNYRLLEQLSEAIIESLRPHTATLVQLFVAGCQDPSISVSKAAMMSTSAYISCLPINAEEVMQMQVVLTPILSVMTNCLQTDEQVVSDGLEVFQECLLMKQPLINDHLEALVPFVVGIIQTEDYDQPLRAAAGQTLMTIMENRPKLVAKKNLVTPTLSCMASIIAKSTENAKMFNFSETTGTLEEEEDDEDDETSMLQLAHMCIDTMALHIPSKHFIEPALALCSQGMQSTDPSMRKAGCAILGLISEGCCDPLRPLLPTIIPALVAAVSDDDVNTKEMACFALGQFSEHCQPEILSFHTGILPALYNALDDPRVNILQTACYVLEMFCEFLDQDSLRPYLEALLSKLGALLQHPSDQVQGTALAAISSTVLAAEMEILPYVPGMCALLQTKLALTEVKDHPIRGRSLQLLGHISVSIGGDKFAPYVNMCMASAQENITIGDADLREFSYIFYANVAKSMKVAFVPALPTLMPHLLEVANESEYIFNGGSDDEEEGPEGAQTAVTTTADEDNDDVLDDDEDGIEINGYEGFVITKKSAITALACVAEFTEEHIGPYLPQIFEIFLSESGPLGSYHESIRGEAYEAMQHFVTALCATQGLKQGPPTGVVITLPDQLVPVIMKALRTSIAEITGGDDKGVVAKCYRTIGGILNRVGAVALTLADDADIQVGQLLLQAIKTSLAQQLPCQTLEPEEDDEEGDGGDDHDNELMDDVTDLIGILAKVMGPGFIPHFDLLLPDLLKFSTGNRVHSDRSMAVGCFGEVLAEIGPDSVKYGAVILPLIAASVTDEMEGVRRNAAFCLCALIDSAGVALAPNYLQILQMLYPICTRSADAKTIDTGADVDNALSAVSKMIKYSPEAIPLETVLPVMLSSLPLRNDMAEGYSVYGSLTRLLVAQNATALQYLPQIIAIFGYELSSESKATEEAKAVIVIGLKSANSAFAPAVSQALSNVQNPSHAAALQAAIIS